MCSIKSTGFTRLGIVRVNGIRRTVLSSDQCSMLSTHVLAVYCPTLTKGSNLQITQIWESDVLIGLSIFYWFQVWNRNTPPAERYLSHDIPILHWCQCTWQTHFAHYFTRNFIFKSCFLLSVYGSVIHFPPATCSSILRASKTVVCQVLVHLTSCPNNCTTRDFIPF